MIGGILLAQANYFQGEQMGGGFSVPATTESIGPMLTVIGLILGGIASIVLLVSLLRLIVRHRHETHPEELPVILLLTVPKEQQLKEKAGDATIEQIRGYIATAETFFAAIGGLKPEHGFHSWFFGRHDHITFEIIANGGLIYFYVAVPRKYRNLIEQQMQAQYPFIQIEETDDYNMFKPTDIAAGAYLRFEKTSAYPFKTYPQLDSDPLNALLNPLSKLADTGQVVIQYVIRSAKKEWRHSSKHHIKLITEGKKEGSKVMDMLSATAKLATSDKKVEKEMYKTTPLEEQLIKSIDEKASRAGLDCNIRIISAAPTETAAMQTLKNSISSFSQYNLYQFGNSFKAEVPRNPKKLINDFIFRRYQEHRHMVLNTQEMASVWHLPLPSTEIPNIKWLGARKSAPPDNVPKEGVILGFNLYRGVRTEIRIKPSDRLRHMYVIGMTGTGKSTLLSNQAAQDIKNGEGVCVMDPHGELAEAVIGCVPPERIDDVIYFDPADTSRPMGLNMLEFDPNFPDQKTFVINEILNIFDKLYDLKATGGPMFEQYMRNAILLLMEDVESGSTLMEVPKVLADEDFRRYKLSKTKNPVVHDFWTKEAEKAGGEASLANMVPYITSKLTQFISNDVMRPIIAQQESAFNFRKVMDEKKILLVNLSKGRMGEMNANLLGMIIVGKILMASLSRTDIPEAQRSPFYLYIDEFQNFLTQGVATILSEARKYGLSLNIAHQYIGQLVSKGDESIKNAIFGNVGTKVCFRIGTEDAEFLGKEFAPVFSDFDLMNVEARNAYMKLMINGAAGRPFNMATYPPPKGDLELATALKELSKLTYGRDRELVEEEIKARTLLF